jgi:fructose-bisphosphate aldolase class II
VTLARAKDLVSAAVARGTAVPAFNVITLEHAEAIVSGAESAGVGVLLQISENAIRYHGRFAPLLAACRELASSGSVSVGIHLDHIEASGLARDLIDRAETFGAGSIMVDASTLDYVANVAETSRLAADAHARGLWVEAELGAIGGKDGAKAPSAHAPGARTDPSEAIAFVAATGVDALAVAVGSSHAMTEKSASLDLALLESLAAEVPVPLVLHGSSGISDALLAQAIAAGVRKVNVGTALNVAWTAAVRAYLATETGGVDPRRYLTAARTEAAAVVAHLCDVIAGR